MGCRRCDRFSNRTCAQRPSDSSVISCCPYGSPLMVHWMPCSPPRLASNTKSASTSVSCAPTHIGTRGFCGGANVGVGTGFPRASTVARTRVRRAKRSTTGYVEAPPEGMVRSTSMRFPGANSKPDAASGRAVCIPSTAITWAESFPKSGAYTRPFEVFTRRSRTRSPGRTLSRADVCPLTVTTCPQRPSWARSWRVTKFGSISPPASRRKSSSTHTSSRL